MLPFISILNPLRHWNLPCFDCLDTNFYLLTPWIREQSITQKISFLTYNQFILDVFAKKVLSGFAFSHS